MNLRSRLAVFAGLSIALGGVAVVACGGSDSSNADLFDAGSESSDNDTGGGGIDSGGGLDSGSLQDTSSSDVRTDVVLRDTGIPNLLDAGPLYEGGLPCIVGGSVEQEDNDSKGNANTLSGTVCGTITFAPPNEVDVDFYKFTLQNTTTTFTIFFSGNVKLTVQVAGHPDTVLTPTSGPAVPFELGKEYSVKVESNESPTVTMKQNYTVTLEEK